MKKRPMIVACVSVVLLAALAWMLQGPDKTETRDPRVTKSSTRSVDAALENSNESPRRERRGSTPASRIDSSLTRHDASKLVNFILPKLEGKDVTIQQALAILKEAYLDACYLSREKPLALKFSVDDDPGYTISFALKGKSFTACLNYLAALAGLEARRNEANIELFRSEAAGLPSELSIQKYQAAMPQLRELAGQQSAVGENDWEALLRTSGFILESGTTLTDGKDGFFVIKGSNADINRVKSALELATTPANQLKLATRLIETDSPIDIEDSNLAPSDATALMRELASRAGTKLTTEPSVTARDGQSATVEITHEKIDGDQVDWTGLKHEMSVTYTGLKLVGSDKSEKRSENAEASGWLSENEFALYPGDTHVQLVSSGSGAYRYRLLTATPIDATGRPLLAGETPEEDIVFTDPDAPEETPVNNGSPPTASAVPGKAGFIFSPFNNKVIDVTDVPSGTMVMDPTYPASEKKFFRVP